MRELAESHLEPSPFFAASHAFFCYSFNTCPPCASAAPHPTDIINLSSFPHPEDRNCLIPEHIPRWCSKGFDHYMLWLLVRRYVVFSTRRYQRCTPFLEDPSLPWYALSVDLSTPIPPHVTLFTAKQDTQQGVVDTIILTLEPPHRFILGVFAGCGDSFEYWKSEVGPAELEDHVSWSPILRSLLLRLVCAFDFPCLCHEGDYHVGYSGALVV